MSYRITLGLLFIATNIVYAQCDYSSELSCNQNIDCEWVATYQWYDCDNFSNSTQCNNYSEYGCYWDSHWYYSGWSDCDGPSFQIETGGDCQEVEMPECFEMNEMECSITDSCDWIDNIETGSCSALSLSVCDLPEYGSCYSDCTNWGNYYNGMFCYGTMFCNGGSYQSDNSYCEEAEYQLGDINGDTSINILDVIATVNLIQDNQYDFVVDMDSNGVINILDVIQLINFIIDRS